MPPPEIILASSSAYRRELLSRLLLSFEAIAPGVDESPRPLETPLRRAQRLALEKASAVASLRAEATIIGSDQVAVCKGELLEKPGTAERCREQLHWLSASAASYYTAVAIVQVQRGQTLEFVDTTTVYFRALSNGEIERYIAAEQPFDCAGAIRSERLGVTLFTRIVTEDPTALIGLPLITVARALRQLGYELP
jgi:septum formation protein